MTYNYLDSLAERVIPRKAADIRLAIWLLIKYPEARTARAVSRYSELNLICELGDMFL